MADRGCGLRPVRPGSAGLIPAGLASAGDGTLAIGVRRELGYVLVTVAGEVDIATAPRLRERLCELAAGGCPLVADLDQVGFIDASGLGALAVAAGHGAGLYVVCARRLTRQLFALTGLDRTIPMAPALAGALQALATARDAPVRGRGGGDRRPRPGPRPTGVAPDDVAPDRSGGVVTGETEAV